MDPRLKEYLLQKYPEKLMASEGQYQQEAAQVDDALAPSTGKVGLNMLRSLLGGGSYDTLAKQTTDKYNQKREMALRPLKEGQENASKTFSEAKKVFDVGEDFTKSERDTKIFDRDEDTFKRESDPTSLESQIARALAQKMGAKAGVKIPDTLTAAQLKGSSKALSEMYRMEMEAQQDRQRANESYQLRRDSKESIALQRQALADQKNQDKIDKQIVTLSKDIEGAQGSLGAIDKIEETLGFKLEDADTSDGLKVGGKSKDLPGTSIPGLGRYSFYNKDARQLKDRAASVFNAVLKDRSGAAVTTPELERLKTEFSEGKFNTEPELIKALQLYKRETQRALMNRQAGYVPEAVDEYEKRGGRVFRPQQNTSDSTLDQKRKRLAEINAQLAGD